MGIIKKVEHTLENIALIGLSVGPSILFPGCAPKPNNQEQKTESRVVQNKPLERFSWRIFNAKNSRLIKTLDEMYKDPYNLEKIKIFGETYLFAKLLEKNPTERGLARLERLVNSNAYTEMDTVNAIFNEVLVGYGGEIGTSSSLEEQLKSKAEFIKTWKGYHLSDDILNRLRFDELGQNVLEAPGVPDVLSFLEYVEVRFKNVNINGRKMNLDRRYSRDEYNNWKAVPIPKGDPTGGDTGPVADKFGSSEILKENMEIFADKVYSEVDYAQLEGVKIEPFIFPGPAEWVWDSSKDISTLPWKKLIVGFDINGDFGSIKGKNALVDFTIKYIVTNTKDTLVCDSVRVKTDIDADKNSQFHSRRYTNSFNTPLDKGLTNYIVGVSITNNFDSRKQSVRRYFTLDNNLSLAEFVPMIISNYQGDNNSNPKTNRWAGVPNFRAEQTFKRGENAGIWFPIVGLGNCGKKYCGEINLFLLPKGKVKEGNARVRDIITPFTSDTSSSSAITPYSAKEIKGYIGTFPIESEGPNKYAIINFRVPNNLSGPCEIYLSESIYNPKTNSYQEKSMISKEVNIK